MRLIDADTLIEILTTAIRNMKGMAKFIGAEDDPEIQMEIKAYTDIADGVKDMPTIEERKTGQWIPSGEKPPEEGSYLVWMPSAQRWTPCSERMPEEHKSIWAKAKGTDRWTKGMWEKQSDEVIVTELFEDGTTRTDTACTHDGEWYVRVKSVKREIIAWMPLPEPYCPNCSADMKGGQE